MRAGEGTVVAPPLRYTWHRFVSAQLLEPSQKYGEVVLGGELLS
jgi:hypothetical protein